MMNNLKRVTLLLFSFIILITLSACGKHVDSQVEKPITEQTQKAESSTGKTAPSENNIEDNEKQIPPPSNDKSETPNSEKQEKDSPDEMRPDSDNNKEQFPIPKENDFNISECRPIIENGRYIYNPYLLSQECCDCFEEGFLCFYKDFINAYRNYETVCPCASVEYAKALMMVLEHECPFYSSDDFEFSWAINYDYINQSVFWEYRVSRDTLINRITCVKDEIQRYLDLVNCDTSESEKMQTVYHAFCPQMTYDYDRMSSRYHIDGCYAYTEHTGICVTFSYALSQILEQLDIYATTCSGLTHDGESHVWNYISIDNNFYFFDSTFELNYKNGTAFTCYGMTLQERDATGVDTECMWIGRYDSIIPDTPETHLNIL